MDFAAEIRVPKDKFGIEHGVFAVVEAKVTLSQPNSQLVHGLCQLADIVQLVHLVQRCSTKGQDKKKFAKNRRVRDN